MGDIVWLASFPKSGNTWMRAFLYNLFSNRERSFDVNRMTGEIFQSDGALMWYQMIDPRPLAEWSAEDLACMRPRVDELIAQVQEGTLFCKTHNALMTIHKHPTINLSVTSGAIYIVRNPLDTVLSFADFLGLSIDQAIDFMATRDHETPHDPAMNNVGIILGSWSQHVESWTGNPNPRLHVVRYEDMLDHPSRTFGATARFLGLKPSRQRLLQAIRNSSFKALRSQEDQKGFKEKSPAQEKFFRRGTAGQWREELTPEQVERVCSHHRVQMERFGYLPPEYAGT